MASLLPSLIPGVFVVSSRGCPAPRALLRPAMYACIHKATVACAHPVLLPSQAGIVLPKNSLGWPRGVPTVEGNIMAPAFIRNYY